MKLLAKTNRSYIYFSLFIFLFVGLAFYWLIEYVIYQDVEERLKVERKDFENFVEAEGEWEESCYFVENKIELAAVADTLQPLVAFKDTIFFNRYDNEYVPFREHNFYAMVGPQPYRVSIRKSLIESNKLLTVITTSMLGLLSIGLFLMYMWQNRMSRKAWAPFYETLSKAKSFDLEQGEGLNIKSAEIFEFNELNEVLNRMTDKISRDYRNLKEFTENAAHEIQTPLALINTRVEELIQEKNFSEKQMYWVQEIYQSAMRLSKLHQALLLLSKIENGQFMDAEDVDFSVIAGRRLEELEDVLMHKHLEICVENVEPFVVTMNHSLAEVMVTNLLNNAIRHNVDKGSVKVVSTAHSFSIMNTGQPLSVEPERLFERFKKQHQASASLGLGLAIVKKIADSFGLQISYQYHDRLHIITLTHPATTLPAREA